MKIFQFTNFHQEKLITDVETYSEIIVRAEDEYSAKKIINDSKFRLVQIDSDGKAQLRNEEISDLSLMKDISSENRFSLDGPEEILYPVLN